MESLTRASIRQHRGGLAGVLIAVLLATTLVTSLGVLIDTGLRGGVAPQRYAGATVIVGAPQTIAIPEDIDLPLPERAPLPADTAARIAQLPGVERAIPDVTVPMTWNEVPLEAHGWDAAALTPYLLAEGRPPAAADEVVIDDSVPAAIGDQITLGHGGEDSAYTVVGVAHGVNGPSPDRARHVFLSDAQAAALWPHPGAVDVIGVIGAPGIAAEDLAHQIRALLPDAEVYRGDRRGDAEFLDAGRARGELVLLGLALAGTALMIAMFVVASTLALSIQQRRREFALLRAVGATPGQIHRMIGREIWLVGTVAALLGAAPGYFLARWLFGQLAGAGVIPPDFPLVYGPLPAVGAAVVCLLTARCAAAIAARRPARINPVDALREAAVQPASLSRGRIVTGVALAVVGLTTSMLPAFLPGPDGVAAAASSVILLIIAAALLGPRLVQLATAALSRPLRMTRSPAMILAAANARGNSRRLAAAITPLALAIALGSVQLFAQSTVSAAAAEQSARGVIADFTVAGPGFSAAAAESIAAVPGVRAANPITRSQVFTTRGSGENQVVQAQSAQGVDPAALAHTMELGVAAGNVGALAEPGTVALSRDLAITLGKHVGDTVGLTLGDGTAIEPRVVAIYTRGLGFGDVTFSNELLRPHTSTTLSQSVLVTAEDGRHGHVGESLLTAGYQASPTTLEAAGAAERDGQSWSTLIALTLLLGYLAVAIVNTLVMATSDRRREFALLRLVGASNRQVRAMMRAESVVVITIACLLGIAITIPPLVGVSLGITGQPIPAASPTALGIIVLATAALGWLAIGIPTRRLLRGRPVDAIG